MSELPESSARIWRWFGWYGRRYIRKHFDGMRIMHDGLPPRCEGRAMVVYSNHPSWWDPMAAIVMADWAYRDRRHYAPIDAAMLQKYGIFKRLGFFGVEKETARGAAAFVRISAAILEQRQSCLWVTAQGEFTDVRSRPIVLRAGVAHLARRLEDIALVPAAIEYPFWNERLPEVLVRFGEPIYTAEHPGQSVEQWQARLTMALTSAADKLAIAAKERDASVFETILTGKGGTSVVYDAWRRARAWCGGEKYSSRHGN